MTHARKLPDTKIKMDSDLPAVEDQLLDADREIVDLEDANEVRFLMPVTEEAMINQAAEITNASEGRVRYEFDNGETAIDPGTYDAEWRVSFEDGNTFFLPVQRNLKIEVVSGVDRELDPADFDDPDASVTTLFADEIRSNIGSDVEVYDFRIAEAVDTADSLPNGESGWFYIEDEENYAYWDGGEAPST